MPQMQMKGVGRDSIVEILVNSYLGYLKVTESNNSSIRSTMGLLASSERRELSRISFNALRNEEAVDEKSIVQGMSKHAMALFMNLPEEEQIEGYSELITRIGEISHRRSPENRRLAQEVIGGILGSIKDGAVRAKVERLLQERRI